MTYAWPAIEKQPLDGARTWSATFGSYDQYRELCHYDVTYFDADQPVSTTVVNVGTDFMGDNWLLPEINDELVRRITALAIHDMCFADIARQRRLDASTTQLGELQWNVDADGYLRIPPPDECEGILRLMVRRGLEPTLVTALLDHFPDRPLERALIAWDVVTGCLLGAKDWQLTARLSAALAPLRQLGVTGYAAVTRDGLAAMIEAVRPSGDTAALLDDFMTIPSLAALVGLSAVRSELADDSAIAKAVLGYASRLAWAHLPSLALAFLQILWDRFAVPQALDSLIEIGLDFGIADAIPAMGQDDRAMVHQAYLGLRAALTSFDARNARAWIDALDQHPAVRSSLDPRLVLARAELALLENKRFDEASVAVIEAIAPPTSTWRYAARVRDAVKMQSSPHLTAHLVFWSITEFGNHAQEWLRASLEPAARAELLALVSREIRFVSHDPHAWRALALLASDGEAIEDQVVERLFAQLAEGMSG